MTIAVFALLVILSASFHHKAPVVVTPVQVDNTPEWIRKQEAAYKRKTDTDPRLQRMIAQQEEIDRINAATERAKRVAKGLNDFGDALDNVSKAVHGDYHAN
jgi:hypothetical protein